MENLNKFTTPTTETLVGQLKAELKQERENMKSRRIFINISGEDFKTLFELKAKIIMTKRNQQKEFTIDNDNKEIINQLYYYLIGSKQFEGDLFKGIMLTGTVGTGKTIIMQCFIEIIESLSIKVFAKHHSKAIASIYKAEGEHYFDKRPLFIDDIGKETKVVNDYGTVKATIPDIFALRYDFGSWTFATNNYKFSTLKEFYGETIVDRFKEMFNNLELTGKSRRV